MWLALNSDASPSVLDDRDVGRVDVLIGLDEMVAEDGGEQLRRVDWVLLGHDICGLLHRVCGYDRAVVGFGVPELILAGYASKLHWCTHDTSISPSNRTQTVIS